MTDEQKDFIKELKAKHAELSQICVRGETLDIFPKLEQRMELDKIDFAFKEQIVLFENFLNS